MIEILLGVMIIAILVLMLSAVLVATRGRLLPAEALTITVNTDTAIKALRGDKLLEVLHGANIGIPAACGGTGTCGLCRVTVTGDGAGQPQATEKGVLSAAERKAHLRLACQTTLRGACEVSVPQALLGATGFTCRVLSNQQLAPLIRELVLELPEGQAFDFHAGDFMQLTCPAYQLEFRDLKLAKPFREAWHIAGWDKMQVKSDSPVTRAYSIASRPEDERQAVFNIRLAVPPAGQELDTPPGLVSSWLFSLEPGATVDASGPFGEFHVQDTDREMIFIGGGVGMAPLRAMIHEQINKGTTRKMRYFYGARSLSDLYYTNEFEAIDTAYPNFSWTPALSDPAPGDRWTGATGFVHEIVRTELGSHPAPEDCEYYLCGPPVMISSVVAMLERLGVEPHSIFNDDFGS